MTDPRSTKQENETQEPVSDTQVKNPNPRANENLSDEETAALPDSGAGSEITDGEDA